MTRLRFAAVIAIASTGVSACFESTCSCLPPITEQQWIATSSFGDSAELTLQRRVSSAELGGSGVLHPRQLGQLKLLTLTGEWDESNDAPRVLNIAGWFGSLVGWTSNTARRDSLYGILRLPPNTAPGDTLGVFLRRRR
jgi:hypothetical protein